MTQEKNKNTQNHNIEKNNCLDDKEFKRLLEQVSHEDYAAFRILVDK
ncbi:hypothetical protein AALF85_02725 [Jeotgalicoccus halotolerans]